MISCETSFPHSVFDERNVDILVAVERVKVVLVVIVVVRVVIAVVPVV